MKHGVVEGEPGIFPAPVARVLRTIGGLFGHKKHDPPPASAPPEDTPYTDLDPQPPATPPTPGDSITSEE